LYQFIRQWVLNKIFDFIPCHASNFPPRNQQDTSDGSGSKFFDPAWVRSAIFGLGFGFEKFPLKTSNFSIFSPLDQKNLFGLGQKVPGSKAGQPLFTADQNKLASGQGPSLQGIPSRGIGNLQWLKKKLYVYGQFSCPLTLYESVDFTWLKLRI